MDLMFLGTGAAEGIPAMFCRCGYCSRARLNGGKDIRTRSSFRIDGKHQIDFSPDMFSQVNRSHLDLFELEHLLITHTHEDHLDVAQLFTRDSAVPVSSAPLSIYINEQGVEWVTGLLRHYLGQARLNRILLDRIRIVPTRCFESFQAGALAAVPLKANHRSFGADECAQNYLIRLPDGRMLLYATDTGWYAEETWEYLRGKHADIVILEATYGGRTDRDSHPADHLDIRSALLMLDKMQELGLINTGARIYTTHFNHKHNLLHEDMQTAFDQSRHKIIAAWDGLAIDAD